MIGGNVRRLREQRSLSQIQLASAAGVTQGYLSRVERGLFDLKLTQAASLTEKLKISIEELFKPSE